MKIALVQLDAAEAGLWNCGGLRQIIRHLEGVDLVVFPESFPFARTIDLAQAEASLCLASRVNPGLAFIAGGLVKVGRVRRNAVFLVVREQIAGTYFKRIPFAEQIEPGREATVFRWTANGRDHCCVPLICADACDFPSDLGRTLVGEVIACIEAVRRDAAAAGRGSKVEVPIVVATYSALQQTYWPEALSTWAWACNVPVVVCGVAGRSRHSFRLDWEPHPYGGGGSGVFWPDGGCVQRFEPGIFVIETEPVCKRGLVP